MPDGALPELLDEPPLASVEIFGAHNNRFESLLLQLGHSTSLSSIENGTRFSNSCPHFLHL